MAAGQTVLHVEAGEDFVVTPFIESVCQRGVAYLETGYPVHLSGPAGTGKTTLALHLAGLRGRPVMLIHGDEEFGSSDLLGGEKGLVSRRVVDNFIRSVLKTEETVKSQWVDHRLTIACRQGYTLVYDEFSRSHAEANNALLPILEERLLALPTSGNGTSYLRVHPAFRAIFTSNPDEYAGVYTPQSALLDRMVTIKLGYYDRDTEIAITRAKAGLSLDEAGQLVDLVRAARQEPPSNKLSVRACIMLGRILRHRQARVELDDPAFLETCLDVFSPSFIANERLRQIIETALGPHTAPGRREEDANASQ
jgi:gas vesicle protein GvpN